MFKIVRLSHLPTVTEEEYYALSCHGIRYGNLFLLVGKTTSLRERLSQEVGIDRERLLTIAHMCDMMRIPGMTTAKLKVLRMAEIMTIRDMKNADLHNLLKKIKENNPEGGILTDMRSLHNLWLNVFYSNPIVGG